jgi:hypothetical protein
MTAAHPIAAPGESEDTHPKLHLWLKRRKLSSAAAAVMLCATRQSVDTWRLPFGHRRRVKPSDSQLEIIVRVTGGEVTAADFYPPHLRHRPDCRGGDPVVLRHARAL